MGNVIYIKELLLDGLEEEVLEILHRNGSDQWEYLLKTRRVNDRIKRIQRNIGFPKVEYSQSYYTPCNKINYI